MQHVEPPAGPQQSTAQLGERTGAAELDGELPSGPGSPKEDEQRGPQGGSVCASAGSAAVLPTPRTDSAGEARGGGGGGGVGGMHGGVLRWRRRREDFAVEPPARRASEAGGGGSAGGARSGGGGSAGGAAAVNGAPPPPVSLLAAQLAAPPRPGWRGRLGRWVGLGAANPNRPPGWFRQVRSRRARAPPRTTSIGPCPLPPPSPSARASQPAANSQLAPLTWRDADVSGPDLHDQTCPHQDQQPRRALPDLLSRLRRAQVAVLTWRELLTATRNPADVAGRMLVFCWVAVVVGLIFYSIGSYFESLRCAVLSRPQTALGHRLTASRSGEWRQEPHGPRGWRARMVAACVLLAVRARGAACAEPAARAAVPLSPVQPHSSRLDVMFIETCILLLLPYVYMSL